MDLMLFQAACSWQYLLNRLYLEKGETKKFYSEKPWLHSHFVVLFFVSPVGSNELFRPAGSGYGKKKSSLFRMF